MKKLLTLLTLTGAMALPAAAQLGPFQTNLDPDAAVKEIQAVQAQRGALTALSPEQATANALRRCAGLLEYYRVDCEARVHGWGQVSGSVRDGGVLKQTVTILPATQLAAQQRLLPGLMPPPPLHPHAQDGMAATPAPERVSLR